MGSQQGVQHSNLLSLTNPDWNTTNNLSTLNIDPALIELEFISRINGNGETDKRVSEANRGSSAINHDSYIVQLRGSTGHAPLTTPPADVYTNGSIPQGVVKVTDVHIIHNAGDEELARLEELLRNNPPEGTVVSHPTGSLLSHHSGQCRSMEFLTSSMRLNPLRLVKNGWKLLQVG